MDMRAIQASLAYAKALGNAAQGGSPGQGKGDVLDGQSFSALLGDALTGAAAAGNKEQTMAMQAIAGKASLPDLAAAVNQAEVTLNTVVAIRDRVVTAYNTIINMPI
jgi:flagellar hook-basal body complex protein FliE